ncbi:MAG: mevalonate kinase [Anaerolineae bacterium]
MVSASAPAKAILIGEHAVVYGRPAIAIPLPDIRAEATIAPSAPGSGVRLAAPDLDRVVLVGASPHDDPLAVTVANTLDYLGVGQPPDLVITLRSAIPLARGMGSGAAISTAIVRALAAYLGQTLESVDVSSLVYQTEVLFHGTPSGIDNTVVAYGQPVYFIRGIGPEPLSVGGVLRFLIADTGVASPTRVAVGDVRTAWLSEPQRYEALFDAIAAEVEDARVAIASGNARALGGAMNAAHTFLCEIGVSSPELDRLVVAARHAGALGAKLSGGGRGGIALALVDGDHEAGVTAALRQAGAEEVLDATLRPDS